MLGLCHGTAWAFTTPATLTLPNAPVKAPGDAKHASAHNLKLSVLPPSSCCRQNIYIICRRGIENRGAGDLLRPFCKHLANSRIFAAHESCQSLLRCNEAADAWCGCLFL